MQQSLFDLDLLSDAAPAAPSPGNALAKKIAERMTTMARSHSDSIAAWAKSSPLKPADLEVGTVIVNDYGTAFSVAAILRRGDGDLSLLMSEADHGDRSRVAHCVRMDFDGSFVCVNGERYLREADVPERGEDTGAPMGLKVGDIAAGFSYWPHVVIARRGRWGIALQTGRHAQETVCFLGDGLKVPDALAPAVPAALPREVADAARVIFASQVSAKLEQSLALPWGETKIRQLWDICDSVPEEMRDDPAFDGALARLLEIFVFPLESAEWTGTATVDCSDGWRLSIEADAVHKTTQKRWCAEVDYFLNDKPGISECFDVERRATRLLQALEKARTYVTPEPPPPTRRSRPKKIAVEAEAFERHRTIASLLATECTDPAETDALAKIGGCTRQATSIEEFAALSAAVDPIVKRKHAERDAAIVQLFSCTWGPEELRRAKAIVDAPLSEHLGYSEKFRSLEDAVEACVLAPLVGEVAPNCWVCVFPAKSYGGLYGAVSSTGYHSNLNFEIATPEAAAIRFTSEGIPARATTMEGVSGELIRWQRSLTPPLECNEARQIAELIEVRRKTHAVRCAMAEAIRLLNDGNSVADRARLQHTLVDARHLEEEDSLLAAALREALADRFGTAKPEVKETAPDLFDNDSDGEGDEHGQSGAEDGDNEE